MAEKEPKKHNLENNKNISREPGLPNNFDQLSPGRQRAAIKRAEWWNKMNRAEKEALERGP